MRISIFVRTFFMLLISFTLVFLFSMYTTNRKIGPMYIERNTTLVKETIIKESERIKTGVLLEDTSLMDLSAETSFVRYKINAITEEIGPNFLNEEDILNFVIDLEVNEHAIQENNLTYYETVSNDVHIVNYIYEFEYGDYLIVSTRIQSLQNIELVLNELNITQFISVFITITILSILISTSISRPLKKINAYAKDVSNLHFEGSIDIKRNDEFKDIVTSLNEMTFNLQKSYTELSQANSKLSNDIAFEKKQEEKKKQLIYTINHELKTPLSVMKGMIEGMIDGVGRYKDKDKYLEELLTQINKVETITKDLTYSLRLEDKAKPGDFVNTVYLLDHFLALDEYATQRDKKISKEIKPASVLMNEELFIILLSNLIKNAVTYSLGQTIRITTEINNEDYYFIIRNQGHIKEEDLSLIFESFYRSDYVNMYHNGSGLGLSIVKQICELYGYECKVFNDNKDVVAKVKLKIKK